MRGELTDLLDRMGRGDAEAGHEVAELTYDELHALAARALARERSGHTLQPTALVHEAFLRLLGPHPRFENRAHFFGAAARAMRRVLVDHARRHAAQRRGGNALRVTLAEGVAPPGAAALDILALNEALERLEARDPRKHRIVELRFFAGLDAEEVAQLLDVSARTVQRDWEYARAWLFREMGRAP